MCVSDSTSRCAEGAEQKPEYKNMVGRAHDKSLWIKERRSDGTNNGTFSWSKEPEPHVGRRKMILAKYPEIKKLMRPDNLSAVFCLGEVLFQFAMAYWCTFLPWWAVIALSYFVSGTLSVSLQLAMHELSHDLWFKTRRFNQYFAFIANLPCAVPSSATFKRYHLEHHTYQGVDQIDCDIPSHLETWLLRSTLGKMIFVQFQWAFYAFRPMLIRPKSHNKDEIANWIIVVAWDIFVFMYFGPKAFFYFLGGSLLGMGIHPMTAHAISEHYEFIEGQETYSYYGIMNYMSYNVGYHNEHHDFPRIPGRLLPQVTAIAPEFYLNIPSYTSWCQLLWDFIFESNMSLWQRIKREEETMFNKKVQEDVTGKDTSIGSVDDATGAITGESTTTIESDKPKVE